MNANNYFLTKQAVDYHDVLSILKHHKKSGRLIEKDGLPVVSKLSPMVEYAYDISGLKAFGPLSIPNKGMGLAYPKELRGKIYTESVEHPHQQELFRKQGINPDILKDKVHYDTHDAVMMNHEAREIELGDKLPQSTTGQRGGHISMSGVVGGNDNNFVYGAKKTLKDMVHNTGKDMKFADNIDNSAKAKPIHMAYPELGRQLKVVDGTSVLHKARISRGEVEMLNAQQPTHMVTPAENRGVKGLSKVEKYLKEKQGNPSLNEPQDLLDRDIKRHTMKFGEEKLGKKQQKVMMEKELGIYNMPNEEKAEFIKDNMEKQRKRAETELDYNNYNKWRKGNENTDEYFKPATYNGEYEEILKNRKKG